MTIGKHTPKRRGDWAQTSGGRKIWPLDPRPGDFDIFDIAHHLATVNRFNGAAREPYSVGQHSVLISRKLPPGLRLAGLLHDAPEYILADLIRPVKHDPALASYRDVEECMLRAMAAQFGFACPLDPMIKRVETRMLVTELRDLLVDPPGPWKVQADPYPEVLKPWGWRKARREFLADFAEARFEARTS